MVDKASHPISREPEMAEPASRVTSSLESSQSSHSSNSDRKRSNSSAAASTKKLLTSQTPATTNSPRPSRESSPIRPPLKPPINSTRSAAGKSRKNSSQETSPSRAPSSSNPPSSAAIQRALSATSTPQLHPSISELSIRTHTPQKLTVTTELKDAPKWPSSPRLRSPPPTNKSLSGPRKADQDLPAINLQRSTPVTELHTSADAESEDLLMITGSKTPARGVSGTGSTLETVQEISQPNTPATYTDTSKDKFEDTLRQMTEQDNGIDHTLNKNAKSKASTGANESGSESGGTKREMKMRTTSTAAVGAPPTAVKLSNPLVAKAYNLPSAGRGKPSGEGSTKNMTVETETVSSIPQVAVGGGAGGAGVNGSLRAKPSSETIRPKKDKRKTTRKAPSVTSGIGEPLNSYKPKSHHHHSVRSGAESTSMKSANQSGSAAKYLAYGQRGSTTLQTQIVSHRSSLQSLNVSAMLTRQPRVASSKADIFEAKIASAVEDANSSDSEETFVYESNPPEASDRPRRFHSRTPSTTSMASQVDQRGNGRSTHGVLDNGHSVAMKKSMKFTNTYINNAEPGAGEDDGSGTARSTTGTGRGTTHHHHIGRWGRNGGNGHPSLFDNESPFPNAARSKLANNTSRHSSRPTSPRVSSAKTLNGKKGSHISSGYDIDDGAGADDERTPLMSTVRSARSGRNRRPNPSSLRQMEHQGPRQDRSWFSRFAGFLVLSFMMLLVISGAIGFMFATTQPLSEVEIVALKKIIASGQELMLDIEVVARNPNIMAVNIDALSLDIFAKSKHAGTDSEWWKHPRGGEPLSGSDWQGDVEMLDDDPRDPPYDENDPGKMPILLLGRVEEFSSPLIFDGSPLKHTHSFSSGQVRLAKPGNSTEPSGSERWDQVLKHDFDLIVKGTLKYQLPLSQRVRSVSIDGRATVMPNHGGGAGEEVHIV